MADLLLLAGRGNSQGLIDSLANQLEAEARSLGLTVQRVGQAGSVSTLASEVAGYLKQYDPRVLVPVGYTAAVTLAEFSWGIPVVPALPDIPGSAVSPFPSTLEKLGALAQVSDFFIATGEAERSSLEYRVAGAAGKVLLPDELPAVQELCRDLPEVSPTRVLVSGHDFRFVADLVRFLRRFTGVEVRLQRWDLAQAEPTDAQRADAEWADVVLAEWAGRQAVWFSQNLAEHQRLLVHLHGFEASAAWISELNIDRIEKVIFVSDFYREQVKQALGWAQEKLAVIPNAVETAALARQKRKGACFHLGMLGFTPFLKRPDIAVKVLSLLLEKDDRFILHLRGKSPWQHDWLWQRNLIETDAYQELYQQIAESDSLRQHLVFEPYGANVESWFRGIGWVLSLSDRETFHVAAAEGMASGAVPVFLQRDGVTEVFSDRWVFDSPEAIARFIYETVSNDVWQQESDSAQSYAARFDRALVRTLWQEAIFR